MTGVLAYGAGVRIRTRAPMRLAGDMLTEGDRGPMNLFFCLRWLVAAKVCEKGLTAGPGNNEIFTNGLFVGIFECKN